VVIRSVLLLPGGFRVELTRKFPSPYCLLEELGLVDDIRFGYHLSAKYCWVWEEKFTSNPRHFSFDSGFPSLLQFPESRNINIP